MDSHRLHRIAKRVSSVQDIYFGPDRCKACRGVGCPACRDTGKQRTEKDEKHSDAVNSFLDRFYDPASRKYHPEHYVVRTGPNEYVLSPFDYDAYKDELASGRRYSIFEIKSAIRGKDVSLIMDPDPDVWDPLWTNGDEITTELRDMLVLQT